MLLNPCRLHRELVLREPPVCCKNVKKERPQTVASSWIAPVGLWSLTGIFIMALALDTDISVNSRSFGIFTRTTERKSHAQDLYDR